MRKVTQKQKPFRSSKYLEFVRSHNCQACGTNQRIQAHHLIGHGGRGMGTKSDDRLTMALCANCHHDLHQDPKRWDIEHRFMRLDGQLHMIRIMLTRAVMTKGAPISKAQIDEAREILK